MGWDNTGAPTTSGFHTHKFEPIEGTNVCANCDKFEDNPIHVTRCECGDMRDNPHCPIHNPILVKKCICTFPSSGAIQISPNCPVHDYYDSKCSCIGKGNGLLTRAASCPIHGAPSEKGVEFTHGAKRSTRKPPYFLVPIELIEAVAWTRLEGDKKYGVDNWKKGDKAFFVDCLCHAQEHLHKAADTGDQDSLMIHLSHAACNIAFILWAMKRGKVDREDFWEVSHV